MSNNKFKENMKSKFFFYFFFNWAVNSLYVD